MKTCSRVACLVLIVAVVLAGCGPAATPAPAMKTEIAPPVVVTFMLTDEVLPPTMTPMPTQTLLPPSPTQPPAADTPIPTAAPATPAISPVPTLAELPLGGLWHGGGTDLLVDFFINTGNGDAFVSDVGILWQGHVECELNARYQVELPLDENGFKMSYNKDDIAFEFYTTQVSPELILGLFELRYKGCGEHTVTWRAVPKTGISQRP